MSQPKPIALYDAPEAIREASVPELLIAISDVSHPNLGNSLHDLEGHIGVRLGAYVLSNGEVCRAPARRHLDAAVLDGYPYLQRPGGILLRLSGLDKPTPDRIASDWTLHDIPVAGHRGEHFVRAIHFGLSRRTFRTGSDTVESVPVVSRRVMTKLKVQHEAIVPVSGSDVFVSSHRTPWGHARSHRISES